MANINWNISVTLTAEERSLFRTVSSGYYNDKPMPTNCLIVQHPTEFQEQLYAYHYRCVECLKDYLSYLELSTLPTELPAVCGLCPFCTVYECQRIRRSARTCYKEILTRARECGKGLNFDDLVVSDILFREFSKFNGALKFVRSCENWMDMVEPADVL